MPFLLMRSMFYALFTRYVLDATLPGQAPAPESDKRS
jgi:hypothetical protein